MNGAITCIAPGPDQEQKIFFIAVLVQFARELAGGLRGLAVDFKDYIARLKARFVGGTGGTHVLNYNAAELFRRIDLLTRIRRQVGDGESELAGLLAV
jgi:hypothetical protein